MKKVFVTILAFLYLGASSGAMVTMHYCMGQLADTQLGQNKAKSCQKCGMAKTTPNKKGCCKDVHQFIKDNSDQKTTEAGIQLLHLTATVQPALYAFQWYDFTGSQTVTHPVNHSPPYQSGPPLFIRNCVFLI